MNSSPQTLEDVLRQKHIYGNISDSIYLPYFYLNVFLGSLGILLNFWVLFVLIAKTLRAKAKFTLIISMAFADILSCLALLAYITFPEERKIPENLFGQLLCRLVLNRFLAFTFSAASAWHVVMVCIERYVSIKAPDWYDLHFSKKYYVTMIVFSWTVAFVAMFANVLVTDVRTHTCHVGWEKDLHLALYGGFQFLLLAVIPLAIMIVMYYKIALRYKSVGSFLNTGPVALDVNYRTKKKSKKVFVTMLALVLFYVVSWLPSELYWLLYCCDVIDIQQHCATQIIYLAVTTLTVVNAVSNPILYACSFAEFRYRSWRKLSDSGHLLLACVLCQTDKVKLICKHLFWTDKSATGICSESTEPSNTRNNTLIDMNSLTYSQSYSRAQSLEQF